jgi:hypothetical protein
MWDFSHVQSGLATAVLDFTRELSPLGVGLVGAVWLSVGLIVFLAVQHYLSQAARSPVDAEPAPADYRRAA